MKLFAERSRSHFKRPSKSQLLGYQDTKKPVKYDLDFIKRNSKESRKKDDESDYLIRNKFNTAKQSPSKISNEILNPAFLKKPRLNHKESSKKINDLVLNINDMLKKEKQAKYLSQK